MSARPWPSRPGALLLEMLVALGLFVMTALAVSASMSRGMDAIVRDRDLARARDLARSAMAKIEAHLASPESLDGPVEDESEDRIAFDEGPVEDTGWELVVDREPSEFEGLSVVRVTARRVDPASERVLVSATLYQLVRVREDAGEDIVGEAGDLLDAAREGADRAGGSRGDGP